MRAHVEPELRRNRGWPWPDKSFGLDAMYGADGWCRSCGVPRAPQSGPLTLTKKGLNGQGAWAPYWRYEAICLSESLAKLVSAEFDVELIEVSWRGMAPGRAFQIVSPVVGEAWFDHEELRSSIMTKRDVAGEQCEECGVWRWNPVVPEVLPTLTQSLSLEGHDVAASPEWFGSGLQSFRLLLFRRELVDLLANDSPRDFRVGTFPRA